ncbi:hypothetical protein NKG05_19190 [Oerskovia sp. M15]
MLRNDGEHHPVTARLTAMSAASQAAVLQLDPLTDRGEYNTSCGCWRVRSDLTAWLRMPGQRRQPGWPLRPCSTRTRSRPRSGLQGDRRPRARAARREPRGPGLGRVGRVGQSVSEVLAEGPRAVVVDLGSLHTHEEQLAVSLALLDDLWADRASRTPASS